MDVLETWTRSEHTADVAGRPATHPVWRKGVGPGVVVVHEMPGLTAGVVRFGEELVAAGYTVLLPHLFGPVGREFSNVDVVRTLPRVCISREFTKIASGVTTPVAGWLRSLARDLHDELGGPGVGALGMCFTGGFALAMMVDETTVAPVVCQPSTPFIGLPGRAADLNLSPADAEAVRRRAADGCAVLGVRYTSDPLVGTRFDTLASLVGDRFIRVDLPGRGHSTVTEQRSQAAVDAVLEFFGQRLHG
ncbi:putative dienelactone hydrolase [Nocardioides flavus (ex Wang et al. 2016)]|uniref:Dienelactone hydrolase n=1 Tax=Nocardioides flavus (ex Wang et al. 2016) TaxID=2058780 RepID=A0ABQ3HQA6_9ACTN|nr:dienelactone hydrolase family protein [Nocardioides flavus (ex Wang et al. 2016)]GHE18871.1 putative dienelactone hydrolase [Nocardioides flavus (ex Wang et al. 2016)]